MITNYVSEVVKSLTKEKAEVLLSVAAREQMTFDGLVNENMRQMDVKGLYFDFALAERANGQDGIKAVYDEVVERFKDDYKMITELAVCLNWKTWQHYNAGDETTARYYDGLWAQVPDFFYSTFEGNEEAETYYFEVTD